MTIDLSKVAILAILLGLGAIWLMIRAELPASSDELSDRQW
jgi:hypothetical protein